jgi:hypothetical protein
MPLTSEQDVCWGCLKTGAEHNIWTWAGGTGMGLVKTAYEILVETHEGKTNWKAWTQNLMDLQDTVWDGVNWINLAQDGTDDELLCSR